MIIPCEDDEGKDDSGFVAIVVFSGDWPERMVQCADAAIVFSTRSE